MMSWWAGVYRDMSKRRTFKFCFKSVLFWPVWYPKVALAIKSPYTFSIKIRKNVVIPIASVNGSDADGCVSPTLKRFWKRIVVGRLIAQVQPPTDSPPTSHWLFAIGNRRVIFHARLELPWRGTWCNCADQGERFAPGHGGSQWKIECFGCAFTTQEKCGCRDVWRFGDALKFGAQHCSGKDSL